MKQTATDSLKTIVTILLGFIVCYIGFKSVYFLYAALVIGTVSLLSASMAGYIHKAWMLLAKLLSYVMPNIVMGVLFYLFLTPIALIQRLIKKNNPLLLQKQGSTFISTSKTFSQKDFEKPW